MMKETKMNSDLSASVKREYEAPQLVLMMFEPADMLMTSGQPVTGYDGYPNNEDWPPMI